MCDFLSSVNWLEWAKALFDLIKGVAWPLAAFSLVWIFRIELRDRVKDIIQLGPTGAVLQPPSQTAQPKAPPGLDNDQIQSSSGATAAPHLLSTAQALSEKIRQQLQEIPADQRSERLISALAEAQMQRQFEFLWGLIFNSQVIALRRLREFGSISFEEAKKMYETEVRPAFSDFANWEFEDWSKFLILQELVKLEDGAFTLTNMGQDFLIFVDIMKRDQKKGL